MGAELDESYRPPKHLRPKVRAISKRLFAAAKEPARVLGWNLIAHGSFERDLDLVAVPWTDDAAPEMDLVLALRDAFAAASGGDCYYYGRKDWKAKPHGRLAVNLILMNGVSSRAGLHPFIDLSIIPRRRRRCAA